MLQFNVRNVQEALPEGLFHLQAMGVERDSRNGPVRLFTMPVTTTYQKPRERVIFWPERDANPFFHLFESLWMLGGRRDVAFCTQFVKTMANFSDDGKTFHGAYGWRWREHWGFDQLGAIIAALTVNADDRRCVLGMWDPAVDLGRQGKDVPCNTQAYFWIDTNGAVSMTVCNRSNDMVWGAYGANAVHFSYLLEYIAAGVGRPVGQYYQMSNNLHGYLDTLKQVEALAHVGSGEVGPLEYCPYTRGEVEPYPLVSTPLRQWQEDLSVFLHDGPIVGLRDPFFRRVATPMWMAHRAFKENKGFDKYDAPLEILRQCKATDWRLAATQWIERRKASAIEKGKI